MNTRVAELADALDSGSSEAFMGFKSPSFSIGLSFGYVLYQALSLFPVPLLFPTDNLFNFFHKDRARMRYAFRAAGVFKGEGEKKLFLKPSFFL